MRHSAISGIVVGIAGVCLLAYGARSSPTLAFVGAVWIIVGVWLGYLAWSRRNSGKTTAGVTGFDAFPPDPPDAHSGHIDVDAGGH
jgi:uncharacterized membrane protein HdeD (DUF308 family)